MVHCGRHAPLPRGHRRECWRAARRLDCTLDWTRGEIFLQYLAFHLADETATALARLAGLAMHSRAKRVAHLSINHLAHLLVLRQPIAASVPQNLGALVPNQVCLSRQNVTQQRHEWRFTILVFGQDVIAAHLLAN